MRLVFLGTPVDAVAPLRALVEAGHEVALVLTQPDRRRSRRGGDDPSPVKQAATGLGLPVLTPTRAREAIDDVAATGAQLGVVVGFGQLLPPAFLDTLPHGFVNLHYSLLPRWRGAAPVERAILAGDTETGVCLMRIEEGLDTGGIYASVSTPIAPEETAGELHERLTELGTRLLLEHLPLVPERGPVPQEGEPTYAEKLAVDEFRIDGSRPAVEVARVVRAGNPRPGAWMVVEGKRVKVWRALAEAGEGDPGVVRRPGELVTTAGVLRMDEVQPEGKPRMTSRAWMAGLRERALSVETVEAS
ncbi:MAG TPA: methionyl-tRNA formyltransferase [Acidimicrobiia bacterium]|nr:methionyl-tRNA formyltransferase [Acidimicrobiia bacterium]